MMKMHFRRNRGLIAIWNLNMTMVQLGSNGQLSAFCQDIEKSFLLSGKVFQQIKPYLFTHPNPTDGIICWIIS